MRVLIITHIFWPEYADYKNLPLATELVARGHEVTVLTAFPNYPLGHLYDGYALSWRKWQDINCIRVLRVPLYPDHSSSGLKRLLNYGSFTLSASTIGLALAGKVDVVYVHSPPMTIGITAGLFKLLHRAPIVLDVVDLWPEAIIGSGMAFSRWLIKAAELTARIAYHLADKITVLTNGFAARLAAAGVPMEKISVMPPWADRSLYISKSRNAEFGEKHSLHDKFCIMHAGNVGPFQDVENILAAAGRLCHIDSLRIILVGGGRDLEKMKMQKEACKLDNVVFAGNYPAEAMAGIYQWADALLVSLRSDPYLAINLPSKMPGYMAAGRPIIACAEGETSQLVKNNHLGLHCAPGEPDLLAQTIRQCIALPEEERREMGMRGRRLFEQHFDKNILIGRYVEMFERLALGHT